MPTTNIIRMLLVTGLTLILSNFISCTSSLEANSGINNGEQAISESTINDFPIEDLNQGEIDGLIFMREEEKLARDVYITLYEKWGKRVFTNISSAEQTHTDIIKMLINKYELTDPVEIDSIGVFQNEVLQGLYITLTQQGSSSLIEALKVGALIEEIDILDIQRELDEHVDNQDITFVYENLMKGSRNHLRAFVRNLSRQGVSYSPQKLSEDEYLSIISSPWERGRP